MTHGELLNIADSRISLLNGESALECDCELAVLLLEKCDIDIPEESRYFVNVSCDGIMSHVADERKKKFAYLKRDAGLSGGEAALAYTGECDFSHTSAEWESVISLGIYGLRERIAEYALKNGNREKTKGFYKNILSVYDAALEFMRRAAEKAESMHRTEMAESLKRLVCGSPTTLYEALQTSVIYYTLQLSFDGTYLRTLGRLDALLAPFYEREDKETAEAMLLDYVREIDKLRAPSNIPFAIGCIGSAAVNDLSYALLRAYEKAGTTNTKMHILYRSDTPDDILSEAFSAIRAGNNSIVFMSDRKITESLEKHGVEPSDAENYHVVGCYECGGSGEITCSCNARVNIPKALELALNGGRDMLTGELIGLEPKNGGKIETYGELYEEFERQLVYLCGCAVRATDLCEAHYSEIHSAPVLSGTYASALEAGGDLYGAYTAKYNSSSLNAIGLATAVDSLTAIKHAVFSEKRVTLAELTEILRSNWRENEYLRLFIKNKYPKYGQGNAEADETAARIVDTLSLAVSNKPNAKGGTYRLGLFSIDWRWAFGERTAASADGRLCGETLSQNTSASFGADTEGLTAHLLSASSIDTSKTPNGTIVDIDLHISSVRGENGIRALNSSLRTYFELGGFAVHYNVLDTEILKAAKKDPAKYPALQVRLCGWNVLFSSLSEREKDEFIARSEK